MNWIFTPWYRTPINDEEQKRKTHIVLSEKKDPMTKKKKKKHIKLMLQLKIIMRILKIIMKKNRCKIEQIQKALNLKQYTSHFGHHVMHMWNWIFRLAHRSMDCAIWINKWYASTYSNSLRHIYLLNWYKLIFICWHTHLSIICSVFFFDCISANDCSLNVNIHSYMSCTIVCWVDVDCFFF